VDASAPSRPRIANGYKQSHGAAIAGSGTIDVLNPVGAGGVYLKKLVIIGPAGAAGSQLLLEYVQQVPHGPLLEFPILGLDASQALNVVTDLDELFVPPGSSAPVDIRFFNPGGAATGALTLFLSWFDPLAQPEA